MLRLAAGTKPLDVALAEINGNCDAIARILNVVQIISVIGIVDIDVIALIPVDRPVFRHRVKESEPIAVILKARIPGKNHQRKAENAEPVVPAKIAPETVLRNPIPVVAAALLPGAMLNLPATCTMLLPNTPLFALRYALSSF